MLCPVIDHISSDSLGYSGGGSGTTGGFWWSLHFKWIYGIRKVVENLPNAKPSDTFVAPYKYLKKAYGGSKNDDLKKVLQLTV